MRAKLVVLMLALAGLVVVPVVVAKEMPQKVTITAPNAAWEIEIFEDVEMLEALMSMSLEDYTTRTSETPEGISEESYLISRFHLNDAGDYVLLDASRYYRNADEDMPGYLFYEGRANAPSDWDNQWYSPDPASEALLLSLIRDGENSPDAAKSEVFRPFFQLISLLLAAL